jgi:hypothetical protein
MNITDVGHLTGDGTMVKQAGKRHIRPTDGMGNRRFLHRSIFKDYDELNMIRPGTVCRHRPCKPDDDLIKRLEEAGTPTSAEAMCTSASTPSLITESSHAWTWTHSGLLS